MTDAKRQENRKRYVSPRLTVHGNVAAVTAAVDSTGAGDGKVKGTNEFKTA
jgi:hypothetical protein